MSTRVWAVLVLVGVLVACAPVATQTPPIVAYYTVLEGDTIWEVAARYGVPARDIVELNGLVTSEVQTGQQLAIPRRSGDEYAIHWVESGESWEWVAFTYDVEADDLADQNALSLGQQPSAGQPLYVPLAIIGKDR